MASITVNKARAIIRKTLEKGTELALKPGQSTLTGAIHGA